MNRELERILSGDPQCVGEPGRQPKRRAARPGAFIWTRQRTRAAELLGWLGVIDTAAAVGVSRRTLSRWRSVEEFRVRVAELAEAPDEDDDEEDEVE